MPPSALMWIRAESSRRRGAWRSSVGGAVVVVGLVVTASGCVPENSRPAQTPSGQDQAHPTQQSGSGAGPAPSRGRPRAQGPAATPSATTGAVPTGGASPATSPTTGSVAGSAYSTWRLGVHVLPRTADGYGEIEPTPASLRVRRYRTTDLLPAPTDGAWHSTIAPITAAIRARMGTTYAAGCPVPLSELSYLTLSFRGFDGAAHTGELVVAASQARKVTSVFHTLFEAGFPIEEMRLPGTADLDAAPTGDGNDTAGFLCRPTRGTTSTFSAHAYGLAIDVNPFDNPYLNGDVVLPERASAYLDRARVRPGMVEPGDVVVRAFARIGWSWGGDFNSLKDYQHFTETGR